MTREAAVDAELVELTTVPPCSSWRTILRAALSLAAAIGLLSYMYVTTFGAAQDLRQDRTFANVAALSGALGITIIYAAYVTYGLANIAEFFGWPKTACRLRSVAGYMQLH